MSKNHDLVTIAIPIYNAECYLGNAIQSTLNQTYTNFELILIDDGSTDHSLEIARSFNDDRIIIISDGENKGLATRLNETVALAKGKYYARMDADDIMTTDRIEIQINYLRQHPEVDLVGSNVFLIDTSNSIYGYLEMKESPSSVSDIENHKCFIHPTVFGLTNWFRENPYNPKKRRTEDGDLWRRTILTSNFKTLSQSVLFYRQLGLFSKKKYIMGYRESRMRVRQLYAKSPISMYLKLLNTYVMQFVILLICSVNLLDTYIRYRAYNSLKHIDLSIIKLKLNSAIKMN